jgi:hypothetical protein
MKFKQVVLLVVIGALLLSGCSSSSRPVGSSSSTQVKAPTAESGSSTSESETEKSSRGTVLADCKAYQAGYETESFYDFLESEWDAFEAGTATRFKSQDFQDLWTTVQNGNFPYWDDVGYVVYELCWEKANFEIRIPYEEPAPEVEMVEMPNLLLVRSREATSWLYRQGYKFNTYVRDVATSPSVACKINDTALIFEQEPAPGTLVENSFDTRVTLYINCQG